MTWTNITNAQLAIGAPIRSIDLLALRDNITAQANGDAGAPQQQTAGIADNAVTAQKVKYGAGLTASGDTLVVASVSANAVGSYAFVSARIDAGSTITQGSNYSAGGGNLQLSLYSQIIVDGPNGNLSSGGISGTWKWLGNTILAVAGAGGSVHAGSLAVRVA